MASPETFGYEPDEDGNICFITAKSAFVIHDFQEYGDFVRAYFTDLVANNKGFMPVITFDAPPPPIPEGLYPEDEDDE